MNSTSKNDAKNNSKSHQSPLINAHVPDMTNICTHPSCSPATEEMVLARNFRVWLRAEPRCAALHNRATARVLLLHDDASIQSISEGETSLIKEERIILRFIFFN